MQEDTDYVDSLNTESKRTDAIKQKHNIDEKDSPGEKKEKKYEQKLDYRCEGMLAGG